MFPNARVTKLRILIICCCTLFLVKIVATSRIINNDAPTVWLFDGNRQTNKPPTNNNNNKSQIHLVGSLDLARELGKNLVLANNGPPTTTLPSPPPPTPEFEAPIGNHTVAMGRDAQLSCKIRDLGSFRTAWLRVEDKGILTIHNNIITRNYRFGLINHEDGREFTLTIKNVQPSDKGGYMCQINSVPMKYAIGYLDVLTPPAFNEQARLQDENHGRDQETGLITLAEGANATLTCKASGHPTPEISWRREDGQPILLDGAARTDNQGPAVVEGPTLNLGAVHRLNSGAYLCIASNGVQPSASKRQVLNVQFPPVIRIARTEVDASLQEAEVTLSCYVDLNPNTGDFHWVKVPTNASQLEGHADDLSLLEHDELQTSDKFEIVMNQIGNDKLHMSLTIRQIERSDFAMYKCIARNPLGLQSSAIKLYESSTGGSSGMFNRAGGNSKAGRNSMLDDRLSQEFMDKQQNDQAPSGGGRQDPKSSIFSHAHTRSSWVQRASPGGRAGDQMGANELPTSSGVASPLNYHATHRHRRDESVTGANFMRPLKLSLLRWCSLLLMFFCYAPYQSLISLLLSCSMIAILMLQPVRASNSAAQTTSKKLFDR